MDDDLQKKDVTVASDSEKKEIEKIIKRRNEIQKRRTAFEQQWIQNLAFLMGKHYFALEQRNAVSGLEERITWFLTNLERKKTTNRTSNYILPLYRSILSRLLLMKETISVEPLTGTDRDRSAAKVSHELLEDFWQIVNKPNPFLGQKYAGMKQVILKLFSYLLSMGTGYLNPYFNPNTSGKTFLQGEITQDLPIGHVECEVNHPMEMFVDPMNRFVIREKITSVEEVKSVFNVKVEPDKIGLSDFEKQVISLLEGKTGDEIEGAVKVYTLWEIPSDENKNGREVYCTENKVLRKEGLAAEYKSRIPVFKFGYLDMPVANHAQAMIEQLIPLQEEYNFTISRIYAYKKWFAGKVFMPKGCEIETKIDDEIGQIIKYNSAAGKPEYNQAPSFPVQLLEDLNRIRRDMEDIAAAHEVSLSRAPAGVKSGIAIENLTELDNSQIAPQLKHVEDQLSFFSEMVLDIMETRYSEPRIVAISGDDLVSDVSTFRGEEAKGNRRVKISMGSSGPTSRQGRIEYYLALHKEGLISDEKVRELLDMSEDSSAFRVPEKDDEKTIMREKLLKGEEMIPFPWETHQVRLPVLTAFMNTEQFRKLDPMIQQLFVSRRQAQQDYILQEEQVMAPKPQMIQEPAAVA